MSDIPFSVGGGLAWLAVLGGTPFWIGRGSSGHAIGPFRSSAAMAAALKFDDETILDMDLALENALAAEAVPRKKMEGQSVWVYSVDVFDLEKSPKTQGARTLYFGADEDGIIEDTATFEVKNVLSLLQAAILRKQGAPEPRR